MGKVRVVIATLGLLACAVGCGGSDDPIFFVPGPTTIQFQNQQVFISDEGEQTSIDTACAGDWVYAVWEDDEDIYFNRSPDGGATWDANDTQLDADPGAADGDAPQICAEGSRVYVAWRDDRSGFDDIYVNYSADFGATWQATMIRVSFSSDAFSRDHQICCSGMNVYVTWADNRDDDSGDEDLIEDIYLNRSLDGGVSWLGADVRVDTTMPASADSEEPRICCDGARVYIAWEDKRLGNEEDVYFNRSLDSGSTWLVQDVRLDGGDLLSTDSQDIDICCDGVGVRVVWEDERNDVLDGNDDVYVNVSSDAGATWLASEIRLNTNVAGASDSEDPKICCEGNNVYVLWEDDRVNPGGDDSNLYTNSSFDGGQTWEAQDQRVDNKPVVGDDVDNYAIDCDGTSVFVVWEDERNVEPGEVFFNWSRNGGLSWRSQDTRVDRGVIDPLDDDPDDVNMCLNGDSVNVIWTRDAELWSNWSPR